MIINGVIPEQGVMFAFPHVGKAKAVSAFMEQYPSASITLIDGVEVLGICEGCGLPILDGEEYFHDEDGIEWHKECD